ALLDGDLVARARHLAVRPGGGIRPAHRSRFGDSGHSREGNGWNDQCDKELPIAITHDMKPRVPIFLHGTKTPFIPARIARSFGEGPQNASFGLAGRLAGSPGETARVRSCAAYRIPVPDSLLRWIPLRSSLEGKCGRNVRVDDSPTLLPLQLQA